MAAEAFHEAVNMTSEELRAWLLTDSTGPEHELGRQVVRILAKRKVDLTDEDIAVMQDVADFVAERQANQPPDGVRDDAWRHALMTVGHDPVKDLRI